MKKKVMRASEKMIFPISMVFNGIEHVASNGNAVKAYADIANTAIIMTDAYGSVKVIK